VGAANAATIARPSISDGKSLDEARVRSGSCTFRVNGQLGDYPTDFYRRDLLPIGQTIAGPAVVLQMDTTTVIPPQHSFEADLAGNLIIRKTED
jgi:N-methylhydantoinase A